ncbi:MAG: TatD family nuclease-associated radical SAM protein [Oscillospiraceae bacterium]|nr:TatD family nuclease-associated radical SAM protein [Oscillospiraceae bacterium]
MKKAMTLTYETGGNLYLNITNRCPCACTFCIRKNDDGAYGSDPLWLEHEPSAAEMQAAIDERDLDSYPEIVFCGYGEPTMRLEFLLETAGYIRSKKPDAVLRLNTNGLTDLYNPEEAQAAGTDAAARLTPVIDKFSVSLNGGDAAVYDRVTNPAGHPANAYDTMLHFAAAVKAAGREIQFTVVSVISPEEIAAAQQQADALGIPLSVREYIH